MTSPDEKDTPAPKPERQPRTALAGLPDFAEEGLPDMSASASTGGELGELRPEDQVFVEVLVAEREDEQAQANAADPSDSVGPESPDPKPTPDPTHED